MTIFYSFIPCASESVHCFETRHARMGADRQAYAGKATEKLSSLMSPTSIVGDYSRVSPG